MFFFSEQPVGKADRQRSGEEINELRSESGRFGKRMVLVELTWRIDRDGLASNSPVSRIEKNIRESGSALTSIRVDFHHFCSGFAREKRRKNLTPLESCVVGALNDAESGAYTKNASGKELKDVPRTVSAASLRRGKACSSNIVPFRVLMAMTRRRLLGSV